MITNLVRAELRKVRATPMTWWLLLGTVAVGIIGTLAPLIAVDEGADLLSDEQIQGALHGAAGGSILVMVTAIIGMAGEWRYGQVTQAFLTSPRRSRFVTAKTIVYVGVGLVYGTAAALAAALTAAGWYNSRDLALPFERSAVWLTLLGCIAVSVLFGAIGVALGAIARNQVAAITAALAWTVLVEPALFAAAPSVFRWLPGIAALSLRQQPRDELLPAGTAAVVVIAVLVVAMAIGIRKVEGDDVTA